MELKEWLLSRVSEETARDYIRYFERYRAYFESLRLAGLPCNSWLWKLAGLWLDYLLYTGSLGVEEYSLKRVEVQALRRMCSRRLQKRGSGLDRCPLRPRLPDRRTSWFYVALLALESGVRVKQLWRAARGGVEPELVEGGFVVADLRQDYGFKRVNVVVARFYTWRRASRVLRGASYGYVKKVFHERGWTSPGCYRKYHWNLCLEATGDRLLCGFIQGRWRPVEIGHYEDYTRRSVGALNRMLPAVDALARGASLSVALRLLKDQPALNGVEDHPHPVARPPAEGAGEPLGDGDAEAESLAALVREYSDLLG